jgi:hypothetical protein
MASIVGRIGMNIPVNVRRGFISIWRGDIAWCRWRHFNIMVNGRSKIRCKILFCKIRYVLKLRSSGLPDACGACCAERGEAGGDIITSSARKLAKDGSRIPEVVSGNGSTKASAVAGRAEGWMPYRK